MISTKWGLPTNHTSLEAQETARASVLVEAVYSGDGN